jgi:hypothetical protein
MNNQIGDSFTSLNDQLSKLTRARAYQGQAAGRGAHDAAAGAGGGGRSGKRHGQGQGGESTSEEDELARHYAALGGDSPAIAGRDFPSAASIEYAAGTGGSAAPSVPRPPREPGAPLTDAERARVNELAERSRGATYGASPEYPTPKAPDTDALDAAYRAPGSYSYEYKDPSAQGAAPGRQAGPMAQELTGIPGVVHQGADGMLRVDKGRLTLANTSQTAKHRREIDDLSERLRALEGDPDAVLAAAAGGRAR